MATYLYACEKDGHEIEVKHGMNEDPEIICDVCEGVMKKKLTSGYVGLVDKFFEGNCHEDIAYRRYN